MRDRQEYGLRSHMITTVKLLTGIGATGLALWLVDRIVAG